MLIMKKACIARNALITLALYSSFSSADTELPNTIESELKQVVEEINRSNPKDVDENTTLMLVEQDGAKLTYIMQLNGKVENRELFKERAKQVITSNLCKNESHTYFSENNVTIEYKYLDFEGVPVARFKIDLATC
ncbi:MULTISPECIES: hypothetical protein [Pseudoalteromonas]|uniref:hypothetical protein n=1 Tax=Pseudoalteromonas TaxID=53246 RepID=UPI001583B893|nr:MULTISPECIES: hypothetical protein [Pseudoalteromonas]MDI4652653.1 hypothetical protein [Pseudoalteromonas shioyasakiensis]NUJ38637.1 hypothetical protein [Pseudoalteromonas sp. 0303]